MKITSENYANAMQADQIYQLGANRIFDAGYAKLLTINCTDMKDKVETINTNKEIIITIDDEDNNL